MRLARLPGVERRCAPAASLGVARAPVERRRSAAQQRRQRAARSATRRVSPQTALVT